MEGDKAAVLARVAAALEAGDRAEAVEVLRADYPFVPFSNAGRRYSEVESTRIFVRDGFLDRYTGARLVFPGALRLLSAALPDEFPYHPNWRTDATHFAFWELSPTIDHVVPVSRGGPDEASNWVTTSMLTNAAKANWTLDELRWKLVPPGDLDAWDGLLGWFLRRAEENPSVFVDARMQAWYRAARGVAAREW